MQLQESIFFKDVDGAIAWAEENCTRAHYSKLNLWQTPGGLAAEEIQDFAHTISAIVGGVKPPLNAAILRYLNSPGQGLKALHAMSVALSAGLPGSIEAETGERLAVVALMAEKRKHLYDRKTSKSQIAKYVGVSRSTFWRNYEREWLQMREVIVVKARDARKKVAQSLGEIGIVFREE